MCNVVLRVIYVAFDLMSFGCSWFYYLLQPLDLWVPDCDVCSLLIRVIFVLLLVLIYWYVELRVC